MKLKITLISNKKVILKKNFNAHLQALIYNMLDKVPAKWLHEKGFKYEKRSFKLFAFSSILEKGKYDETNTLFTFPNRISFYITSPLKWILEQVAINITGKEEIALGENKLYVSEVEVLKPEKIEKEKVRVNALTPIEVHSTLQKADGTKKTYYYSPAESEFNELINSNLKKKWTSLFKEECPHTITTEPVNIRYCKERRRNFKGTVIKGWTGHYYITGAPEFLEFALITGLGSRNSIGFGFVEVVGLQGR